MNNTQREKLNSLKRLKKDLKNSAARRRGEALSSGKLKAASWDGKPSKKKKRQASKNECRNLQYA